MAFILMLGIRGMQALKSTNPLPTPAARETGVISITSAELFNAYQKDAAAADKLHRGSVLEVTGEVILSRGIFENYYIVLSGGRGTDIYQLGVRCIFSGEIDPPVYEVKKHGTATIRGTCDGLQMEVILVQCSLVKYHPGEAKD